MAALSLALTVCACSSKVSPDGAADHPASATSDGSAASASKVGGHSAALWTYTADDEFTDQRDWLYATEALRNARDPFRLAANPAVRSLGVYLDDGSNDPLQSKDEALYEVLKAPS